MQIVNQELELYKSLFRCRDDVYAVRWEKDGKSGYMPVYEVNWTRESIEQKEELLKIIRTKNLKPLMMRHLYLICKVRARWGYIHCLKIIPPDLL